MDAAEQAGYSLSNDRRAESELKEERNEGLIDEHGASAGEKKTCED